jgi:hypothetical protein
MKCNLTSGTNICPSGLHPGEVAQVSSVATGTALGVGLTLFLFLGLGLFFYAVRHLTSVVFPVSDEVRTPLLFISAALAPGVAVFQGANSIRKGRRFAQMRGPVQQLAPQIIASGTAMLITTAALFLISIVTMISSLQLVR